jgi:protein-disulfide isomerase
MGAMVLYRRLQRFWYAWWLLLLTACGAPASVVPTNTRLPTVTPWSTASPTTPTIVPTARATLVATLPPTVVPTPTTLPDDGSGRPVNMQELDLALEPFGALGDPQAPVTIIEFSDFGCQFCRQYALQVFPRLRTEFIDSGKLYYVYKHLPVVSMRGVEAAEAAECAGEQQQYWEMHDQLWLNPAEWNVDPEAAQQVFVQYGVNLGLAAEPLRACLNEKRHAVAVDQDVNEAFRLNIRSTPVFIINRRVLIGSHSYETFVELIQEELAKQP